MATDRPDVEHPVGVEAELATALASLGSLVRQERRRRDLTLAQLAARAQVSTSSVHTAEHGRRSSIEMFVRLVTALDMRLGISLDERDAAATSVSEPMSTQIPDRVPRLHGRDIVHAAMGELEASHLQRLRRDVGIDEPWQHFQFAGRADLVSWDVPGRALLRIENKAQFPDLQDALVRFNSERVYLADAIGLRLGLVQPPMVQTHVMVALWSAEVIAVVRRSPATFRATFPSPPDAFLTWWAGGIPAAGITSALVLLDPFASGRQSRFVGLQAVLAGVRPRVTGYAAAADLVRRARPGA
jgi:transcriptional regulator with XRE-family HTH domain